MGISAVILTKNEEAHIRRCLDSIKDWVDEIVVVDDCSVDQTVAIATREYKAKVVINPLGNNFASQRNIGNEAACHEWILQMDADEIVSPEAVEVIKLSLNQRQFNGFEILRRDCIFNIPLEHVGNCYQRKLFRKSKGSFNGLIHESPQLDGAWGRLNGIILHYPVSSIAAMVAKQNFYTDLECVKYLQENPSIQTAQAKKQLISKPIKSFFKHYFKHQGYKDGVAGLIWSMIHTLHPIIFWLKIIEILQSKSSEANARRH